MPDRVFLARLRAAAADPEAAELATLLALLTGIPHSPAEEPDATPPAFGALLTDNPRLFRRDECGKFDRAHGLRDDPLDESLAAYRRRLTADPYTTSGED